MTLCRLVWASLALAAVAISCGLAWAAFAPLPSMSREKVFQIPQGTWARRRAGDNIDILPAEIRLTLGVQDVLLLVNRDDVPQVFGPALMMPGQSFRLPFETASEYQFACTAHANGQMTVIVEPAPDRPWRRLRWRLARLQERLTSAPTE